MSPPSSLALVKLLSFCKTIVRGKQAAASIEEAHNALPAVKKVRVVHSVRPLGGTEVCVSLQSSPNFTKSVIPLRDQVHFGPIKVCIWSWLMMVLTAAMY